MIKQAQKEKTKTDPVNLFNKFMTSFLSFIFRLFPWRNTFCVSADKRFFSFPTRDSPMNGRGKYLRRKKKQFQKCHKKVVSRKTFKTWMKFLCNDSSVLEFFWVVSGSPPVHEYSLRWFHAGLSPSSNHCLRWNCKWMPSSGRRTISWRSLMSSRFWTDLILNLRTMAEMMDFSSSNANRCPTQFLGPAVECGGGWMNENKEIKESPLFAKSSE